MLITLAHRVQSTESIALETVTAVGRTTACTPVSWEQCHGIASNPCARGSHAATGFGQSVRTRAPTIGAGRESTNLRVSVAPHVPESDSQPVRRTLCGASGEPARHPSSSGVTRSPCEYGLHLAAGFGQCAALDTPATVSICVLSAGDDSVMLRALTRNVSSGNAVADEAPPRCSTSSRECP